MCNTDQYPLFDLGAVPAGPVEFRLDVREYRVECERHWAGRALQDALGNWRKWEELKPDLTRVLRQYHDNPTLEDVSGKHHNPDGSLKSLLWKLAEAWRPEPGRLDPLMDFEEHFQRVFLRRGLVVYCEMILKQLTGVENGGEF